MFILSLSFLYYFCSEFFCLLLFFFSLSTLFCCYFSLIFPVHSSRSRKLSICFTVDYSSITIGVVCIFPSNLVILGVTQSFHSFRLFHVLDFCNSSMDTPIFLRLSPKVIYIIPISSLLHVLQFSHSLPPILFQHYFSSLPPSPSKPIPPLPAPHNLASPSSTPRLCHSTVPPPLLPSVFCIFSIVIGGPYIVPSFLLLTLWMPYSGP